MPIECRNPITFWRHLMFVLDVASNGLYSTAGNLFQCCGMPTIWTPSNARQKPLGSRTSPRKETDPRISIEFMGQLVLLQFVAREDGNSRWLVLRENSLHESGGQRSRFLR